MDQATFLAYLAMTVVFAFSPGPAVLLCVAQGMKNGAKAGVQAAAGIQATNLIYFTLSAVGLGAILAASETLFHVIKWVGAAYLLYLGARTIWNARSATVEGIDPRKVSVLSRPFQQAMLTQLANPKSVLFWGAFMPQFVNPQGDLLVQYAVFAAVAIGVDFVVLSGYGALAAQGRGLLASPRAVAWRERISGGALMAVGASLAAIRRAA